MGGMDGFGPIAPTESEPTFKSEWEGRVLALNRVMQATGEWNIDVGRYWIELLNPIEYLQSSYYRKWHLRLENLCLNRGLVSKDELELGHSTSPGRQLKLKTVKVEDAEKTLVRGSYGRPPTAPAKFCIGDKVITKNINPCSHTRLPRFARARIGSIERTQGFHVFPDHLVANGEERGEWLYTVTFDAWVLWGEDAEPGVKVSIEAFEPYLEAYVG